MKFETLAYLKDGKYRIPVLKELNKSPKLPSELAFNLGISRVSISRILRSLKEKGMVEPHSKESRSIVYTITDDGKIALQGCLK